MAPVLGCLVAIVGCQEDVQEQEESIAEVGQALSIDRDNVAITLRFGHGSGEEVQRLPPMTVGDDALVGVRLAGFRIEDGDEDYVTLVTFVRDINHLGTSAVPHETHGAGAGAFQWEDEFIAPLDHLLVGAELRQRRQENGDRDTINLRFLYARGAHGQRRWSDWIGPDIGQIQNTSTPQSQQIPIGTVMVGLDAWRFREDNGDRDSYQFALRYGEVIP